MDFLVEKNNQDFFVIVKIKIKYNAVLKELIIKELIIL